MVVSTSLIIITLLAVYNDIRTRKIPNWLILSGLLIGILIGLISGGLTGLLYSLTGLLVGILLLIIPFALGGIGAGDVKLLGAIGAIKGVQFVFYAFLSAAVWGGIISLVLLVYHRQMVNIVRWMGKGVKQCGWFLMTKGEHPFSMEPLPATNLAMPYAIPIGLGTITILLWGVIP